MQKTNTAINHSPNIHPLAFRDGIATRPGLKKLILEANRPLQYPHDIPAWAGHPVSAIAVFANGDIVRAEPLTWPVGSPIFLQLIIMAVDQGASISGMVDGRRYDLTQVIEKIYEAPPPHHTESYLDLLPGSQAKFLARPASINTRIRRALAAWRNGL